MNMFEEAAALAGMIKMRNMTQSEISKTLGVSQSYVANKVRLLKLPESVKRKIIDTGVCERHARQILRLDSESDMLSALDKIYERKMTVSEGEIVIDMLIEAEAPRRLLHSEKLSRIRSFESFIENSVKSISSLGISIDQSTEVRNGKKYITIMINENSL